MPKDSIKDKIDGKECDLSLSDLTVVPVKELVSDPGIIAHSFATSCVALWTVVKISHHTEWDHDPNVPQLFLMIPTNYTAAF